MQNNFIQTATTIPKVAHSFNFIIRHFFNSLNVSNFKLKKKYNKGFPKLGEI